MTDLRQLLRGLTVFGGELPTFDPVATPDDPVELFTAWLLGAIRAQVPEPHAMTLATADADGNPSARTLILKDVDAAGWRFAAHDDSTKGRELSARPYAALTFYWQPLARRSGEVEFALAGAEDEAAPLGGREDQRRYLRTAAVAHRDVPLDEGDLDVAADAPRARLPVGVGQVECGPGPAREPLVGDAVGHVTAPPGRRPWPG